MRRDADTRHSTQPDGLRPRPKRLAVEQMSMRLTHMPQSDGADGNGGGGKFNVFKRLGLSRHVIREEAWGRNFGG